MAASMVLMAPRSPPEPSQPGSSVRQRLLAVVRESPGISKSDACVRLGVAWGTVAHHVSRLCRDGLLEVEAVGRRVALFSAGTAAGERRSAPLLRDAHAACVLRLLADERQASLCEVGRALAVSRKVARRVLRGLLAAGLVENTAAGRPRYMLSSRDWVRPPMVMLRPTGASTLPPMPVAVAPAIAG
jgi:predicted ArsR family transcriptional regulator